MRWVWVLAACVGLPFWLVCRVGALPLPYPESPPSQPGGADRAADPGASPLLRVDSSLVLIPVNVTNFFGAPVTGLGRESFRLFEDRVEQTIAAFSTEDTPVSIGLLFDISGSMRTKWNKATEATAAFLRTADPQDEFFLIEFSDHARLVAPFTQDGEEIYRKIAHTRPGGRTSLVDAVCLAVTEMKKARYQRKALVIFSDGGDNWSRHSVHEMRNALLESDVQVYAMGIFDANYLENHPAEERNGPEMLDEITAMSGGRHFRVSALEELPSISERLGRVLRSQYVLGYYSTNRERDGKYRQVQVVLALPNVNALHASYRRGYYGPVQ